MRDAIWRWLAKYLHEGMILPWWAQTARAMLFPLEFICYRIGKAQGYQCENDTWLIEGVRYSGKMLRAISKAQGEIFRVSRSGETVIVERISSEDIKHRKNIMMRE